MLSLLLFILFLVSSDSEMTSCLLLMDRNAVDIFHIDLASGTLINLLILLFFPFLVFCGINHFQIMIPPTQIFLNNLFLNFIFQPQFPLHPLLPLPHLPPTPLPIHSSTFISFSCFVELTEPSSTALRKNKLNISLLTPLFAALVDGPC